MKMKIKQEGKAAKFKKNNKKFVPHKGKKKEWKTPKLRHVKLEKDQYKKYDRSAPQIDKSKIQTKFFKNKVAKKEQNYNYAIKQSARAEILRNEDDGFLVPDEDEEISDITQDNIKAAVDISAATKSFRLNLEDFGPYKVDYTRNGAHMLLGGKKGHVAAFDWVSKKLYCEFNVMEEIHAIQWLHLETLFAVAQKKWVNFYDNIGKEIHCVKKMQYVNQLEYLPYHFLLAGGSEDGWLKWLDISIGEMVAEKHTFDNKITIMKQNPSNATMCVANSKGVVTMWAPSVREPLAKILLHQTAITAMAFNPSGSKMVTTGIDKKLKLWDTRMFSTPLTEYKTRTIVNNIAMSQKNVMAVTMGNVCEIFRNISTGKIQSISSYMRHIEKGAIDSVQFVPFEDVLGIGTTKGFSSILVPGAGESNFDALEQNPFRTKQQRREHEVKALLEKIPAELISLNKSQIIGVDLNKLEEKLKAKPEVTIPMAALKEKKKISGIQKSKVKQVHLAQSKQHLLKAAKVEELREKKKFKKEKHDDDDKNVLDRFKKKSKK